MPGTGDSLSPFRAHDAVSSWIQDIAPYGVFTTDSELRIRSWNQWLSSRGPWPAEKIIDRPLAEAFPELLTRRFMERYQRALAGEISVLSSALHKYLLPFPIQSAGSDVKYMLQTVRIAPLLIAGEIVGTITIVEDVTEREIQALALQRQQQQDSMLSGALTVLARSEDPIKDIAQLLPSFSSNLGFDVFFVHLFDLPTQALKLHAAGGLIGRQKEELQTLPLGSGPCGPCALSRQMVLIPNLESNSDADYGVLRSSRIKHFACFPIVLGDRLFGTMAIAGYAQRAIPADEIKFLATLVQYLAISMERLERQGQLASAQQALQDHADGLEAKVVERTGRLSETIAQLESFSYSVAHDLRAPIRALAGYSEVLEDDFSANLPQDALLIIARIKASSKRLEALTRDLLKFSKVSRGQIEMVAVDVKTLVTSVVSFTPSLETVVAIKDPLGTAWAHDILLRQCLVNIFENAVKFSATDREPAVVVWSEIREVTLQDNSKVHDPFNPAVYDSLNAEGSSVARSNKRLRIWIEDNGVGIPAHARNRIFGIFERVSGTSNVEGTGIGLAIVARAMQQMGGDCGVDSELGVGSRFWLELQMPDSRQGDSFRPR